MDVNYHYSFDTWRLRIAMASVNSEKLEELPDEMLSYTILKSVQGVAPRLGRLAFPGRAVIETPHYVGNTSRGAVPHLSQDNFKKHTDMNAVYVALEDCEYYLEDVGS